MNRLRLIIAVLGFVVCLLLLALFVFAFVSGETDERVYGGLIVALSIMVWAAHGSFKRYRAVRKETGELRSHVDRP